MSKSFEEVVLTLLGQINGRLDRIEARLDGIDLRLDGVEARLDGVAARLDGHDELFTKILEGMAPTMQTTTEHSLKLNDHERRIQHLESA